MHTVDSMLALVGELGYKVEWILDTHVHADNLTPHRTCRVVLEEASLALGSGSYRSRNCFVDDTASR